MIMALAILVAIAPLLAKYHTAPAVVVAKLEEMTAPPPPKAPVDMKHSVWVNRRSGLYYCRDSRFFGRMAPGSFMEQEAAMQKGFRPAQGEACP
jgi:hypothetical protein